jgi:hypothetical protein
VGDACDGAVCADLAPAGPGGSDWQRDLCLRPCDADADCAPYRCRELAAAAGGWARGCFVADVLLDDGSSCRGGDGLLEPGRCASGRCLDFGLRGVCAAGCAGPADCPSYAACATLSGGGTACLARCSARACDADPWLACEAPDAAGALGFTVDESPDPLGYCAPRRCRAAGDCPGGSCPDGFCERS